MLSKEFTGLYDSLGNELYLHDIFKYVNKKWTSHAKIIKHNNTYCIMVTQRDCPDKFIPLEKYIKKHYTERVVANGS